MKFTVYLQVIYCIYSTCSVKLNIYTYYINIFLLFNLPIAKLRPASGNLSFNFFTKVWRTLCSLLTKEIKRGRYLSFSKALLYIVITQIKVIV